MSESPFAETQVRDHTTAPMAYISTPPYRLYSKDLISRYVTRATTHQTLAEGVAEFVRFHLPFIPYRGVALYDSEFMEVLGYIAEGALNLAGTDEAFAELAKHRPGDEVALWQAQATLSTTMPVAEEPVWSPST